MLTEQASSGSDIMSVKLLKKRNTLTMEDINNLQTLILGILKATLPFPLKEWIRKKYIWEFRECESYLILHNTPNAHIV